MKVNGSQPGEVNYLIPLSNGLLTAEHRRRMGIAVWEFAWLIDRTTSEVDGFGIVLGGKPVTYSEIARELGTSPRTTQNNCHTLQNERYIDMQRTPHGIKFRVAKTKKFTPLRMEGTFQSDGKRTEEIFRSDKKEPSDLIGRNLPLHIDNTVDLTEDKERAKKPPADPRFQPIVDHYLKRTGEATGTKPFDAADGKNLRGLLARNAETPLAEFIRSLDNAFDSTDQIPLRRGFRMTEFCRHYSKYTRGPLLKGRQNEAGNWVKEATLA